MIYRKLATEAAETIISWAEFNGVLYGRLDEVDGYIDLGLEDWDILPFYLKGCLPDEDVIDIIFEAGLRDLYENVAKWLLETKQITSENGMGDLKLWPSDAIQKLLDNCGDLRVYCVLERYNTVNYAYFDSTLEDAFKISSLLEDNDMLYVKIYLWRM